MSETHAEDVSALLDLLDSAETFDEQGQHVVTMGGRATAHLPNLCRVEVCGRRAGADPE